MLAFHEGDMNSPAENTVPSVVVVDPQFEHYKPLAASARLGKLDLHFRSSGAEALKLARRLRVDAWLVASELDDVSGADFLELLQARLGDARLAMVESAAPGSAQGQAAQRQANEAGAGPTLSPPITFRDLERLLGLSTEERSVLLAADASPAARALVTLPIGVSAAAVAIAVLMLG
jgi:response regulator RpfG family c-di-GMP phosphodiesterase